MQLLVVLPAPALFLLPLVGCVIVVDCTWAFLRGLMKVSAMATVVGTLQVRLDGRAS